MRLLIWAVILSTVAFTFQQVRANPNNIIDATYGAGTGSFENGTHSGASFDSIFPGSGAIIGWTVGGPGDGVDWLIEPSFNADTGLRSIDLRKFTASSISTTIPTVVGQTYVLSFRTAAVAGRDNTGMVSIGALSTSFSAPFSNQPHNQVYESREFAFTAVSSASTLRFEATGNLSPLEALYGPVIDTVSITAVPAPSTVVTRATRYIGATGTSASTLLASDKLALLPGQTSTFANYTNYSRGLNGIVVDVNGLPSGTTNAQMLASLQFATWDGIAASGFVALPGTVVPTVAIAAGGGAGSSARVTITFADNAVQNTWLRVTVLSNANTGLAANDVFYFGNVIGEFNTGNTATRLRVNATDTGAVRSNQSTAADSASVTNIFDVNRDGRVNATDTGIVRSNQQTAGVVAPIIAP